MKKTALPDHMSVVIPTDKALAMLDTVKDGRINGAEIKKTGGAQYVDSVVEALIDSVTRK